MDDAERRELAAIAVQIVKEEEQEYEQIMMAAARIAVLEIMALEEGQGLEYLPEHQWVPITVNLEEYHMMGDHCFKSHFRMSTELFEILTATVRIHLVEKGRLIRE
ncbi:Pappalysin-1 [Frankliniella fusca]|uniref:Pappalysin-1 n=1 Tax=Frankliniella fusca TaxID=407009 RepID=A0AAE1HQR4_9NEOP|nr:Pappalysin-1 [Frankliniella fusca]